MNLVVVSALGWESSPKAVENILNILAKERELDTTIIDFKTIKTSAKNAVKFNKNLATFNIQGSEKELKSFARNLLLDDIIVIDAMGASIKKVKAFLDSARKIWFHLDDWQPVFAVVYDDYNLAEVAEQISKTFYLMPELINEDELKLKIKKIQL